MYILLNCMYIILDFVLEESCQYFSDQKPLNIYLENCTLHYCSSQTIMQCEQCLFAVQTLLFCTANLTSAHLMLYLCFWSCLSRLFGLILSLILSQDLAKEVDWTSRQVERWWRRRRVEGKGSAITRFKETR